MTDKEIEPTMDLNHRFVQHLIHIIELSVTALIALISLFIGYILAGMTTVILGFNPSLYEFLPLDSDPVFILFGTVIGAFICTESCSKFFCL